MDIVNPLAQQYAEKYTTAEDELLKKVGAFGARHPEAQMLSGHLQGAFLQMISYMVQPKRILEIGTFVGYSALCLCKGLVGGGKLHTIELRDEEVRTASGFFERSKFKEQIILHQGNALHILDTLDEVWDLVFIDADKPNYINYFDRVIPKVRKNGFILADNTLFHGQVLEKEIRGKNAKAIQAFNDHILERTDIEKVLLPLRDGLYLIRVL
ncbi:MAG: O-methyltransferase [Flavisolibacter sp.]|nr:O-methyltransferase [Flavisolibacter sp.]